MNHKLIDYFLDKRESKTLVDSIINCITKLEYDYFINRTLNLLGYVNIPAWCDKVIVSFFQNWCINNDIKEYYLIDKNGSFLVINNKKQKFYFVIHDDATLNNFVEIYEDDRSLTTFIEQIKKRKFIPFFSGINVESIEPNEWGNYLHQANVISNQQNQQQKHYYWCCVPA